MSTPHSEELAETVRAYLKLTRERGDGASGRRQAREEMIVALARYDMAQEDNVIVVAPQAEEPVKAEPLNDFDLLGLIGCAKKVAAYIKNIEGQGYAAEELRWFAEQVEKQINRAPREEGE